MCGIFAAFNLESAALQVYHGLRAQQNRGREAAGIVVNSNPIPIVRFGKGKVKDVFSEQDLKTIHGTAALGHVRYSTVVNNPKLHNIQPIMAKLPKGFVAMAHNGSLTNDLELKQKLGNHWVSSMDSEVILRQFVNSTPQNLGQRINDALRGVSGSYSLVFLVNGTLIAVHDEAENRPLSLGQLGDSYFVSSEPVAFDRIGAKFVCDILPREILVISEKGLESYWLESRGQCLARCIFELVYFANQGSTIFNERVAEVRKNLGRKLEIESPVLSGEAVMSIPDSGNFHALGFAESGRSGRFSFGITRNHDYDPGRTFIEPNQAERVAQIKNKFQIVRSEIQGKNIVLVDDSIVRLNTLPILLELVRQASPREIHIRIACPPITHPCRYGIDTPTRNELIAANLSAEQIRERLGVDSLNYLSLEGLSQSVALPDSYCYACMTGKYPLRE